MRLPPLNTSTSLSPLPLSDDTRPVAGSLLNWVPGLVNDSTKPLAVPVARTKDGVAARQMREGGDEAASSTFDGGGQVAGVDRGARCRVNAQLDRPDRRETAAQSSAEAGAARSARGRQRGIERDDAAGQGEVRRDAVQQR